MTVDDLLADCDPGPCPVCGREMPELCINQRTGEPMRHAPHPRRMVPQGPRQSQDAVSCRPAATESHEQERNDELDTTRRPQQRTEPAVIAALRGDQ